MIHDRRILFVVILSVIILNVEKYDCFPLAENDVKDARVFITISSLLRPDNVTNRIIERNIELNWIILDDELVQNNDLWVGLYTEEPNSNSIPVAKVYINGEGEGSFTTDISYPRYILNITKENDYCMGYWIALVKNNNILVKNCYYARPNWMYEMKYTIGFNSLSDLMIPGTHDAGSYLRENRSQETFKSAMFMCQDEDIWNQLMYGIRFLDLRVTYRNIKGNPEVFWITHSLIRMNLTVREVLRTVKKFLESTNEIVIIDFHRFVFLLNDEPKTYKKLMEMIENEVGQYAVPRSYGYKTTLNELWKENKRLIIGFNSFHAGESILFFPGVTHLWAKTDNLRSLKRYFDNNVCSQPKNKLWSAMAELTPQWPSYLSIWSRSLREMAQEVNLEITRWFRNRFWNCANIVSTDFFLGNDIINIAIESNKRRFDV
ncbi:uncharacterized protein LOC111621764 [Centruroides sculpturatus]|uniref:uncharacterized protein LOC111621764 n=1 Tax=Centruroides sculpturatus TaxID=218467 RepID=UPI000C6C9EE9|nr:uncharacterized protein LOC111621764 [Centruroides sculpturatus]XP_023219773.1 uncharacterized protein LOC111621764 [Centruroides sculpturatus]XP_023219774.1 uncharacterized protein LOC111621764 [Centruroides sculpturatus]